MIVLACSLFMVYEWIAALAHKPKVSDLSHRRPWSFLVWGWFISLGIHFILEARRATSQVDVHGCDRPQGNRGR